MRPDEDHLIGLKPLAKILRSASRSQIETSHSALPMTFVKGARSVVLRRVGRLLLA